MDLSKLKARKAEEHYRRDYGALPKDLRRQVQDDFKAGFTAAEELYRPLLEAVEKISNARERVVSEPGSGGVYIDAGNKEVSRAALESLRKAGE